MDYSLNQVELLPESFNPGGVYFDKETGGVYVAQDSSTKKQFGGTVTGISAPQPSASFTESTPGVNAVQKVSNTSSQGSTDVVTSIVYINGAKLIAMGDGETISYGGSLSGFLQSNLAQGKLFMLSTGSQGSAGFGGRPVSVEQQGSTYLISLVSYGTPYNKIIRWTVTSSNQVTRNDTVLTSSETSIPADIIIDESLLQETNGAVEGEPELVTLLKPYIQAVNAGTTQILPKLFVKKESTVGEVYKLYPASFNGNTGEIDGRFVIHPAILSYHGSSDDGQNPYFYSVRIIYAQNSGANPILIVQNVTSFALPTSDGSSSLVLAQNGTWRSLPSGTTVDSALSSTSTNPVQNKVINEALNDLALAPVFLNMSLINGGTIGADDLAKLKEHESGRPLFFWNFSDPTNQCLSATYNWNGTKLYVSVFSPQPDAVRVENIIYTSSGVFESKTTMNLLVNGDGTKALTDNGSYKTISKIIIGKSMSIGVVSPVQGYRFQRGGLITANPVVGDTLINYVDGQLAIGEIIRVEIGYIYTGTNILTIPITI